MITGVLMVDIHSAAFIKKTGYRWGTLRKESSPNFVYLFSEHRILAPKSLILTIPCFRGTYTL